MSYKVIKKMTYDTNRKLSRVDVPILATAPVLATFYHALFKKLKIIMIMKVYASNFFSVKRAVVLLEIQLFTSIILWRLPK